MWLLLMIFARFAFTCVMMSVRKYPSPFWLKTSSCFSPAAVPTTRMSSRRASLTRRLNAPDAPSSTWMPVTGSNMPTLLGVPHLMPSCVVRLTK